MLQNALSLWENGLPCYRPLAGKDGHMTTMVSQYKVVELTSDGRPWLENVQHLLNEYAHEGWELVTAFQAEGVTPKPADDEIKSQYNDPNDFQAEGVTPKPADPMIRSLSREPRSILCIFKRLL
jgi:hypothetical protein